MSYTDEFEGTPTSYPKPRKYLKPSASLYVHRSNIKYHAAFSR